MDRLGARFWLLILGLAVTFAGTAWIIAHRRELRDGWHAWQVRRQPGYAVLRERWQAIALTTETLHWPGRQILLNHPGATGRKRTWIGPRDMFTDLEQHVAADEAGACADFGDASRMHWANHRCDDRAFGAVLSLRAAGRISTGTCERAMLALARNGENPVHWQDAEGLPVGALVLCDLVSDGRPCSLGHPADSLEEAIAQAAQTRVAATMRESWRRQLWAAGRIRRLSAMCNYSPGERQLGTIRPEPPYEALAFRSLAALGSAAGQVARLSSFPPEDVPGSGWPEKGLPSSSEEAVAGPEWPKQDRAAVLRILRREAELLPEAQRRRFWGVVRLLSEDATLPRIVAELPESRWTESAWPEGPDYSPTLRLIAVILSSGG